MIVQEMREADCFNLVHRQFIARLATCANDQPYVVPVQYALADGMIFSFSMPGLKVDNMRTNPNVCLQMEEMQDSRQWRSVVVTGKFRELHSDEERQHAWEVLQRRKGWWEPGALKPKPLATAVGTSPHLFYTVSIDRITGRLTVDD